MPVTTRIIRADSGSTRNVSGMVSAPDAIHVKTCCSIARTPPTGLEPSRRQTVAADTPKARPIAPVAIAPDTAFGSTRRKTVLSRNPTNGRRGIRISTRSPLQRRESIRVQRFPVPEECNDDGQPDGRLGRRHGHDEEHDDLSIHGLAEP